MRTPYLYTTRMAIFDKRANRFIGNVLGVRPNVVSTNERKWAFDETDKIIVRCSCVQVGGGGGGCGGVSWWGAAPVAGRVGRRLGGLRTTTIITVSRHSTFTG